VRRPELARSYLELLKAQPGRPIALFAPRRVGKTFFLDQPNAPKALPDPLWMLQIEAGLGLAKPAQWRTLGRSDQVIWGECQGSGANPLPSACRIGGRGSPLHMPEPQPRPASQCKTEDPFAAFSARSAANSLASFFLDSRPRDRGG
jgi:hypothetical protein